MVAWWKRREEETIRLTLLEKKLRAVDVFESRALNEIRSFEKRFLRKCKRVGIT